MRSIFTLSWLIIGVIGIAVHFQSKSEINTLDRARKQFTAVYGKLSETKTQADWEKLATRYAKVQEALKPLLKNSARDSQETYEYTFGHEVSDRVKLHEADALLKAGRIDDAIITIEELYEDYHTILRNEKLKGYTKGLSGSDIKQVDIEYSSNLRLALGHAHYYAAWLKRLEGTPSEAWLSHVQRATEIFRSIIEDREKLDPNDPMISILLKDIQKAILLAQMDQKNMKLGKKPKKMPSQRSKKKSKKKKKKKKKKKGKKKKPKPKPEGKKKKFKNVYNQIYGS